MNCEECQNFAKLNIVKETKLCVSCHNFKQWQLGEEYVCNYCHKSCLRVESRIACDSCHGFFTNKLIPKINILNQSKYSDVIKCFRGLVFRHNLELLKEVYNKDCDDIYMCNLPKELIDYIDNSGFCSKKEIELLI